MGSGEMAIFFRGPSLLGLGTDFSPLITPYFVWSLEPCRPHVIDPGALSHPDQSELRDMLAKAQKNDIRHMTLQAAALNYRSLIHKVEAMLSLLFGNETQAEKSPAPPMTQDRISLLVGATRQRTNEALMTLRRQGVLEHNRRSDPYKLRREPATEINTQDMSAEKLSMLICARQTRIMDEKLAHFFDFQNQVREPQPKLSQRQIARLLNSTRPQISTGINRWIDNGLLFYNDEDSLETTLRGRNIIQTIVQGISQRQIRQLFA